MLQKYQMEGEFLFSRASHSHPIAASDVGGWHSPWTMSGLCPAPPGYFGHAEQICLPDVPQSPAVPMSPVDCFIQNMQALSGMSPQQVERLLRQTAAAQGAYVD